MSDPVKMNFNVSVNIDESVTVEQLASVVAALRGVIAKDKDEEPRVCNYCKHLGGDDFCTRIWITPILTRESLDLYSVGAMGGDTERRTEPNVEIDDPTTFGCNQWEPTP